ncbi:MAG: hypothetical protein IPQ08_06170 [Chitinophagaceae bacterium]|nr:hypothetical protein [Chitinophagaceae bacterium]
MIKRCKEASFKIGLGEAKKDENGKISFPVVIIRQGLGNLRDKNYYSAQAIESGISVYEGAKAYFDHPTPTQEREQPNRSVKELVGHYENVRAEKLSDGLMGLKADLVPVQDDEKLVSLLKHSAEHAKKYPDKCFMGISINGDGEGETLDYDKFLSLAKPTPDEMKKISEVKDQDINYITKLTEAISADLVTEPGAGGGFRETKRNQKTKGEKMKTFFKKLLGSLDKEDQKIMESAVKGMLQDESEDEDEAKKKEDEGAMAKEAGSLAKHLLAAKKEMKKEDGESEQEYEAKCVGEALKKHAEAKKEDSEKEKKEDGEDEGKGKAKKEKKAKHEDEDGDEKDAKDKKDDGDEDDDKKEDDGKDDGDDKDHADADQDKKLIKKMMKQMGELAAKVESMQKEGEKHKEEAVVLKAALNKKQKEELVDKLLGESSLPRAVTKDFRPLIEAKGTEKEMREKITSLKELYSKAANSMFTEESSSGFTEIEASSKQSNNDSFFK